MKKLIATSILVLSVSLFYSQEKTKVKEVGITFYNLNGYGAIFKIGQEDRLWRFRALNSNVSFSNENSRYSFSLSAGRERRKSVSDKLSFAYGIELTGGISQNSSHRYQNSIETIASSTSMGLTGVIGFHFEPSKKWFIQAELLPSAIYSINSSKTLENNIVIPQSLSLYNEFRFGFSNNSALLSVGFKF